MPIKRSLGAQSILYPTPVLVIGTYDAEGRPNMMTASWGGVCCSRPPCITVSLRAATYSHGSIAARGAFSVNVPSEDHWREADHVGIVSGRTVDKFATTGLTPVRSDSVDAPYVREFPMAVMCRLTHTHELGLHTQYVGEVVDVLVDEDIIDDRGNVDIEKLRPIVFSPGATVYHAIGALIGMGRTNRELGADR